MPDLYILESCPYCRKVMDFLNENDIEYNKFNISEPENYDNLMKIGGKSQVPFLDDEKNGVRMYESDDIIDYFRNSIKE